jgi:aquaporin Z
VDAIKSLRSHWPEYAIEACALGLFMVAAGAVSAAFEAPASPLHAALPDADFRRALIGIAIGLTAIALVHSPWGQRSGAHMNPAVTLTFWRLGKVARWDAIFYIAAQFIGGTAGVLLATALIGAAFTAPPVNYIVTVPGTSGPWVAFGAELGISTLLMTVVLRVSNSARHARWTGVCAGVLVAAFITLEAPLSGMSMNPARSFASAWPAGSWSGFWIYLAAPVLGMQAAALLHARARGSPRVGCAKLLHPQDQRCIHCGYEPVRR